MTGTEAERAAAAGARAEALGRERDDCPYRRQTPLRAAWEAGWTISRADRSRVARRAAPES